MQRQRKSPNGVWIDAQPNIYCVCGMEEGSLGEDDLFRGAGTAGGLKIHKIPVHPERRFENGFGLDQCCISFLQIEV